MAVFTLLLCNCFSPWKGDTATITINLGAGARAVAHPETSEILPNLEHRITLQGPTGTQKHMLSNGETNAAFSVAPGLWEIAVEAWYENTLYTVGFVSVDVLAGKNNPVAIQMYYTLAAQLSWLETNAKSNTSYTLDMGANETIAPHILSYDDKSGITITLKGVGANRTVSLSSNGSMFTVDSGVTLVLGENITLKGRNNNNTSLVHVNQSGTLRMNAGSIITGNIAAGQSGGGLSVNEGGTFTMTGGEISGNTAGWGGGVIKGGSIIV